MRALAVVMGGVDTEHGLEVAAAEDLAASQDTPPGRWGRETAPTVQDLLLAALAPGALSCVLNVAFWRKRDTLPYMS